MPNSIRTITITEFKSIANLTLELGKINVLIGENGAGKSNILEAIGVLSAAAAGNTSYSSLKERGVRLSAPEVFKMALRGRRRSPIFKLEADFAQGLRYHLTLSPTRGDTGDRIRYWTEELSQWKKKIASRGARKRMTISDEDGDRVSDINEDASVISAAYALDKISDTNSQLLHVLQEYAIYAPTTPVLRNISTDESAKGPLGLYGGSLASALRTFYVPNNTQERYKLIFAMRRLFPWLVYFGQRRPTQNLVSHHIHPGKTVVGFIDKRMSDAFNYLFAYDVSEGVLYALFLLVLVLHKGTPPFFAIDNMDSSLNPRMASALLKEVIHFIKREKSPQKQMIFTTHNPNMLNALDLFDDDIRLYVVERSKEDGSTVVRRINPAAHMTREKWQELAGGNTLAQLWTSGAMGGLPEI